MTDEEKARKESVEKIWGSPVFIESDERTDKVRNHLIFAAAISVFATLTGLHFRGDLPFFGLPITGLTDRVAYSGLGVFILYQLVHYVWCVWDAFLEWRLRVTGMQLPYRTECSQVKRGTTHVSCDSRRCIIGWGLS
jgi:hypothetical protein